MRRGYIDFKSSQSAGDFSRLYRQHDLKGGHVIKLGPGNDEAAREALREWPGTRVERLISGR